MLNEIPTEVNNYKEVANVFERLAAKLEKIDIAKFRRDSEISKYFQKRLLGQGLKRNK
ncbi:MAG: hypothetical protein ACLTAI_08305 [Thomasclavelia sp.]